jgi:hypothetical protein
VARYRSIGNYVADNKREAGAIFLNHLIDLGVVVMNGPMITAGPNLEHYITELDLGRWGHYNMQQQKLQVTGVWRTGTILLQSAVSQIWRR